MTKFDVGDEVSYRGISCRVGGRCNECDAFGRARPTTNRPRSMASNGCMLVESHPLKLFNQTHTDPQAII